MINAHRITKMFFIEEFMDILTNCDDIQIGKHTQVRLSERQREISSPIELIDIIKYKTPLKQAYKETVFT